MQSQLLGTITIVIQIDRHIEILLLDNDCVIVPGLGGFMAHHVCARYCPETQTYLPPLRQLGFNAQLKINDSLLAQSYIEAYDISYPEAIRRIDEEVTELKQKLQNEGHCELNDIGTLSLNVEGNIDFQPCEAGILTPELYGLNSVDIAAMFGVTAESVSAKNEKEQGPVNTILNLTDEPKPEPRLVVASTDDETTDEEETEKTISIRISTLKHIGTVAAAILLLLLCAIPFGKMNQPELTVSSMDTGVLNNIMPKEKCPDKKDTSVKTISYKNSEPVEAQPKAEPKAEKVAEPEQKPANDVKEEQTDKHYFSIVLASRITKNNAQEYVTSLKNAGFSKAEMAVRPNGSVKVVYGKYSSGPEAYKALTQLRESDKSFTDAWIMEF